MRERMEQPEMVAVLFVDKKSIYKTLPGVDAYDVDRDAHTFPGGMPVVAHPPCRTWGKLAHMSTASDDDHQLAVWAVEQVRIWGGVLEHPAHSKLWAHAGLPGPKDGYDEFGGWTMDIDQHWFGHLARKRTWLYICGVKKEDIPGYTINLNMITHVIDTSKRASRGDHRNYKYITKSKRAATPIDLAVWLCELARKVDETMLKNGAFS